MERLKQTALYHVPLRKNNKLLVEEAKAEKAAAAGVITYGTDQPCMGQIYKLLQDQQEKMWSTMQNVMQDRTSGSRDTPVALQINTPALTDYVEEHSQACLKRLAPSSLRAANFIKPSVTIEDKVPGTSLALEDKVPDTEPGSVAGDLSLEPKADPDGSEAEATAGVKADVKAGATAGAAAPSTEPQLTDFEKRMYAAMGKRTAVQAATKNQAASAIKKRPAAAVVEYDISNKPSCPTEHGSTYYNHGKIYTCMPQKKFRVIRDVKLPRTERVVKWAVSNPMNSEWEKALVLIDEYWAKPEKASKGCKK